MARDRRRSAQRPRGGATSKNEGTRNGSSGRPDADLWTTDPRTALRVGPGFQLASLDRASTPGFSGTEEDAVAYTEAITPLLASLQERLFAAAKEGSPKRVLIVAQGLDTAGKGGLARHVMGLVDPQGVRLKAFKAPTEEEKQHDFLWRIRNAVPEAGLIGYFDRSQYEDILVPGAAGELDEGGFGWRVDQIRGFEHELVESGTAIIKVALMVSYEEQGLRLLERLDREDKHWKYSPGDMVTRGRWFDYQSIYQRMLTATSFDEAPWYVIPADNKWYARVALTEILLRTLAEQDVEWPSVDFDVEAERARVRATISAAGLARHDAKLAAKLEKVEVQTEEVAEATAALASNAPDSEAEAVEAARALEGDIKLSKKTLKAARKKAEKKARAEAKEAREAEKRARKAAKEAAEDEKAAEGEAPAEGSEA